MSNKYYCIEKNCNKEVSGKNKRCRSCSKKGNHSAFKGGLISVKCDNCKIEIKISKCSLKQKYHFCSHKCLGEWQSKNCRGKNAFNYIDGRTKAKHYCIESNCNNEISYNNWKQGKGRCKKCDDLYQKGRSCNKGKNHPMFGKHHTEETKKKISRTRIKNGKTKGKNHPMFGKHHTEETKKKMSLAKLGKKLTEETKRLLSLSHGGTGNPYEVDDYPKIFFKIRDSIRKRDNYTCQNCDMTEEEHLIVCGTVLSVHHIDYNKKNSKENNLIILCNQCNVRANKNRNYWKEFYNIKMENINV